LNSQPVKTSLSFDKLEMFNNRKVNVKERLQRMAKVAQEKSTSFILLDLESNGKIKEKESPLTIYNQLQLLDKTNENVVLNISFFIHFHAKFFFNFSSNI